MTNTKTTTKAKPKTASAKKSTSSSSQSTKAELEAQIAELKALLSQQTNQAINAAAVTAQQPIAQQTVPQYYNQPINFTIPSTDVTIVYLSESMGYAEISNMQLYFNRFGEEFTLTRPQFDEIVGKYRSWFDRGVLAVSVKNIDMANAKGLRTDVEYYLTHDKLEKIGDMTDQQLEELWNNISVKEHKESIVSFCKRKIIDGDPKYNTRSKIDLLNRLTNNGFSREQDEINGRYKILPTEM